MLTFMFVYTVVMLAASGFTLTLVPRALRDLGHERQRLQEQIPGAEFDRMVEAGYRMNNALLLVEILYYYLLLGHTGPEWQFFYGGIAFGLVHIIYLVASRLEKRRLKRGSTRTGMARAMLLMTAALTSLELLFLLWVAYLLLQPAAT